MRSGCSWVNFDVGKVNIGQLGERKDNFVLFLKGINNFSGWSITLWMEMNVYQVSV